MLLESVSDGALNKAAKRETGWRRLVNRWGEAVRCVEVSYDELEASCNELEARYNELKEIYDELTASRCADKSYGE